MQMPIINSLQKIIKDSTISFHMPGHKKGEIYDKLEYTNIVSNMYKLDTTEIPGTDNLHNPESSIKESQELAAKVFNSDYSFYLVNGSTGGIQAAIMSICNPKEKILVNRDCHQSVINGCILGDIEPVYIKPTIDDNTGINKGYKLKDVKEIIENDKDIKAVLLTYPSYFGITYNLKEICDYVHSKNKIIIIDEAHGAHFGLSDKLPNTALDEGADIVIQSIHKTLPSFTQSSIIHIKGNRVDKNRLQAMLRLNQSSSPSYILMSSLELAISIYKNNGKELMEELAESIKNVKNIIKSLENIDVYDSDDITKIYILTHNLGMTGYELEEILRNEYNIQVEISNYYGVLLIATIGNNKNDFNLLTDALKHINQNNKKEYKLDSMEYPINIPSKILSPRQAFYEKTVSVPIKESIGKVCGEYIIPYPPGISLVSPGEEITSEVIDYITKCKGLGMNISGVKDQDIEFIEIIDIKQ